MRRLVRSEEMHMAHLAAKTEYLALQQRLDRMPLGAPAHRDFLAILETILTPEEARLAAAIPFKLSSARRIAEAAGMDERRAQEILTSLLPRGVVVDIPGPDGETYYFLNPPIVGFFEFTMMRVRTEVDQKKIAQLMWSYMHQDPEKAFLRLIAESPTFLSRPLVHENALAPEVFSQVLDYEKATEVIAAAGAWSEGLCHCRHVAQHTDRPCKLPLGLCLSLGVGADYLVRNGMAKRIDKQHALDILSQSRELGLVQMCDNVKRRPLFICNCCKCCCGFMDALRTLPPPTKVVTSNYVAAIDETACTGCGKCAKACPIDAIALVPAEPTDAAKKRKQRATVDAVRCLGCAVCHRECKFKALTLQPIGERVHTPEGQMERMLRTAIEHGKLQHLLFDDQSKVTHRALNSLLGLILKLPPAKQALAKEQIKSKFVDVLLQGFSRTKAGKAANI
jgi:ferredoxin